MSGDGGHAAAVVATQPDTSGTWLQFFPVWDVFPVTRGKISRTLTQGRGNQGWAAEHFFQGAVLHHPVVERGPAEKTGRVWAASRWFSSYNKLLVSFCMIWKSCFIETFCKKQFVSFFKSNEVYNTTMCKTRHKASKQPQQLARVLTPAWQWLPSAQPELPYSVSRLQYHVALSFFSWLVFLEEIGLVFKCAVTSGLNKAVKGLCDDQSKMHTGRLWMNKEVAVENLLNAVTLSFVDTH